MQKASYAHRAHDFLEFLYSLAVVALALLGMGGVAYHVLAPGSAIRAWLAGLWGNHPGMVILVLVGFITMAAASLARTDRRSMFRGQTDIPLYLFVALGTFFGARWLLSGAM